MIRRVFLMFVCLSVVGCAAARVYEVPKVQANLSEALRRSDDVTQKAQNDFSDKKSLVENVGKSGSAGFREVEPKLRADLHVMQTQLDVMTAERKKMMAANSNIASLSYGREKLNSTDGDFDKFEGEVKEFQTATTTANTAMAEYSRASNDLTDLIAAKKLYITFESADFYKRVQQNIRVAQDNAETMAEEIDRANKLERPTSMMQTLAQQYTDKAQRLAQISHDMREVTADTRVSNLDPQWPAVQKLMQDLDGTVKALEDINAKFQKSAH